MLIGVGIDQFQLSGLTKRMTLRPAAPPPDSGRKAKVTSPADSTDVADKFHAGKLYITIDMNWAGRRE